MDVPMAEAAPAPTANEADKKIAQPDAQAQQIDQSTDSAAATAALNLSENPAQLGDASKINVPAAENGATEPLAQEMNFVAPSDAAAISSAPVTSQSQPEIATQSTTKPNDAESGPSANTTADVSMSADEVKPTTQEQTVLEHPVQSLQVTAPSTQESSATADASAAPTGAADIDMKDAAPSTAIEKSVKEELIDNAFPPATATNEQSRSDTDAAASRAADEQAAKKAASLIESIEAAKANVAAAPVPKQQAAPTLNASSVTAAPAPSTTLSQPASVQTTKKEAVETAPVATTSAMPQPLPTPSAKARTPPAASARAGPSEDRRAPSRAPSRAPVSASSHAPTPAPAPLSATSRSRQDEIAQMQRESDEMRLMWLSLPSNDHPSYYSDTDDDGASSSSSAADAYNPGASTAQAAYLNKKSLGRDMRKRQRNTWYEQEEEDEYDSQDEDMARLVRQEETMYHHGNRGKKLRKSSRWIRQGKLGECSEARTEKEIHERFTDRVKALQRQNVESMLNNAQGPPLAEAEVDMLDGSDRTLLRDLNKSLDIDENSMMLAPQLLRPIMSARALLQSHTLRHTFRNPHLVALSRTALDLRESENTLGRALARCFGAIEKAGGTLVNGMENGDAVVNGRTSKRSGIDPQAIGAEGTHFTEDELNPAFAQLDRLFVTKEGLPIPLGPPSEDEQMHDVEGEDGSAGHAVLSAGQQRDVVRAALECLHELGADSLEYVERLDEVRTRLTAVKRKRTDVWNALRLWALKRDGDSLEGLTDPSGGSLGTGKDAVEAAKASAAAAESAASRNGAGAAASVASGGASGGAPSGKTGGGGGGSSNRSAKRQRER